MGRNTRELLGFYFLTWVMVAAICSYHKNLSSSESVICTLYVHYSVEYVCYPIFKVNHSEKRLRLNNFKGGTDKEKIKSYINTL